IERARRLERLNAILPLPRRGGEGRGEGEQNVEASIVLLEHSDDNFLIRFAKKLYAPTLNAALRVRWIVLVAAVALFAVSVLVFTRLGAEFVPKLDEGSSTMMIYHPVGLSLEESLNRQFRTDAMVREKFPEVARVFSRIGTSEVATDPMPPNETDFYVSYHPRKE